jgi:hypothetical protein
MLLVLLGCSDLFEPTEVIGVSAEADPCGSFTVTVAVDNLRGQDVELLLDGELLHTWPDAISDHVWVFSSKEPLVQDGVLAVRISGTQGSHETPIARPQPQISAELRPPSAVFRPGSAPRFDLWVSSPCPVDGLSWRATTPEWSSSGPVAEGLTSLSLPAHAEGQHVLQVDVTDLHGVVGTTSARFNVGDVADFDGDGDGYPVSRDCNDADPGVHPDGPERSDPNGQDDNCDGRVDEGTVAFDDDADGYAERAGDCNDLDPRVHPGATELANCRDEDCDAQIDEGLTVERRDDSFERPDGSPYVFEGMPRRLYQDLQLVTRDSTDEESFRFWSHDGDWDSWGIEITAQRVPQDAVYEVKVIRQDGGGTVASGRIGADGDVVAATGAAFRDDSGYYEVIVKPAQVRLDWCPVELTILSR